MTDDRVQLVKQLFQEAVDLAAAERGHFLAERCGADAALRHELEALLATDVRTGDFLEGSRESAQSLAAPELDALVGQTVGGYRIVRLIASGGMGTVYEAVQERLGRTVALKVVRSGLASPAALRRFEYEAKLLARLRHPAIAQIDEVGTHVDREGILGPAGRAVPFFAMEYVPNSRTVVDYAREKRLTTRQRLELFAQVCDAVQYGHQRGVIHRDLKPSNILVGDDNTFSRNPEGSASSARDVYGSRGEARGPSATRLNVQPKIIDFGVARAVDSDQALTSLHTSFGQLVGTLQYMSPEQCGPDAHDIDVRSDIYSLGVVLFELLCGKPPYALLRMSLPEATRVIREELPPRLSAVDRTLRGDLDTIVRKALEKDRDRRYQSAGELAEDARRYLANEPISARPPSMTFQLRAFARRNRALVAGMAAVFLVLVAGIVTTSWQAVRARRSEQQARENLGSSLLAQARARRQTISAGRRTEALEALAQAATIRTDSALRGEVMTTLAVPDVRRRVVPMPPGSNAVVVSDDLSCCAAEHADRSVSVVRLPDGVILGRIPPPPDTVTGYLKWRCDLRRFIRLFDGDNQPRRLEVWRMPENDLLLAISDVPDRASFDVSPDGRTLAVGRTDHAIHLYDLETGTETRRIELDRDPSYLRFDPTGRQLARFHARDTDASVLDLDTGVSSRILEGPSIAFALAWSPDGKLVAGAQEDLIYLWDVTQHKLVAVLAGHEAAVVQLAFSHSGRLLASRGWDTSIIWDLKTLRPLLRTGLACPVFSADDRMIGGIAGADGRQAAALFDFLYEDAYRLIGEETGTQATTGTYGALHPDGRIAAAGFVDRAGTASGLQFFDAARHSVIGRITCGRVETLRFDPSGSSVLSAGVSGLLRWPIRIGDDVLQVGPPQQLLNDPEAAHFDVSADAKRVAVVSSGKRLLSVIDGDHPERTRSFGTLPKGLFVAISPNGKWAAVSTWLGTGGEVWDLDAETVVARLAIGGQALVAFSPDGRWLLVREPGMLTFLRAGTWEEVHRLDVPGFSRPGFSRDGHLLVLVPSDDSNTIRLFDLNTAQELAAFEPPELFTALSSAFSHDGSTLAVFTGRGALLQLWDLRHIRSTLTSMGLDWDHPPIPPAPLGSPPQQLRFEPDLGFLAQSGARGPAGR